MNAIIVNGRGAGWNSLLESDLSYKTWLIVQVVTFC